MKKSLAASVVLASVASVAGVATPASAYMAGVEFSIRVDRSNLSATGHVFDSLGRPFAVTLTAAGPVTCGVVGPQTVIAASAQGYGNPVTLTTPGTCTPYNGEVTYDMVWASVGGTSGHHTVVCVAHLGAVTCSLPGVSFYA